MQFLGRINLPSSEKINATFIYFPEREKSYSRWFEPPVRYLGRFQAPKGRSSFFYNPVMPLLICTSSLQDLLARVQAVRWLKPPAIIPNPFGINRNLKVAWFFSDVADIRER